MKEYFIVSKIHLAKGRSVLISFATFPIVKTYEELKQQNQQPGRWSKIIAGKALRKYFNGSWTIIPFETIQLEYTKYINEH